MNSHLGWFAGEVVHGDGRGRALGFPTANLDAALCPSAVGIYAAWVCISGEDQWREATVSFGDNPTFGDLDVARVECFVHDFDGALYGKRLEGVLVALIRSMQAFESTEKLVSQTRKDVEISRRILRTKSTPTATVTQDCKSSRCA